MVGSIDQRSKSDVERSSRSPDALMTFGVALRVTREP